MLVVVGSTAAPTVTFVGLDLEPAECDELPTCTITRRGGDGGPAEVIEVPASGTTPVQYRGIFEPPEIGHYDVVFDGLVDGRAQRVVTTVEAVGSVLAAVSDVRAHPDMRNRSSVKATRIADLLEEFTDTIATRYRGFSPILRRTTTDLACGRVTLPWPMVHEILGVTLADGTVVAGPFVYGDPAWARRTGWGHSTATVDYVHGAPDVSLGMRRAAVGWSAFTIVAEDAGMARDVLWETTESGTVRYSAPDWGRGRPTGFIVVDAGLNAQPDMRVPGMASA